VSVTLGRIQVEVAKIAERYSLPLGSTIAAWIAATGDLSH